MTEANTRLAFVTLILGLLAGTAFGTVSTTVKFTGRYDLRQCGPVEPGTWPR